MNTTPTNTRNTPPVANPPAVSRFEYTLLRLLRFTLGAMPTDQASQLIAAEYTAPPPCLTATCVRLAQDTLAKGVILHLARAGGWRRDRFLRKGEPVAGRVWERIPLPERSLEFGPHPIGFLMWLTAEKPLEPRTAWNPPATELTPADELFFALVLDAVRPIEGVTAALVKSEPFLKNPLCWLTAPGDFADLTPPTPPNFASCFEGVRAVILECWQRRLTERWTRSERAKGQIADWRWMRNLGAAEQACLGAFLGAANQAGRPDLTRFVLHAAEAILGPQAASNIAHWTGGLQAGPPQRLADRLDTQRMALAVPAQLETLARWDQTARGIGFFDDGYAASQLWKADWAAADGPRLAAQARNLFATLDPLQT